MKFAIKVNRPTEVRNESIPNWRAAFLLEVQNNDTTILYNFDDYTAAVHPQPLRMINGVVHYDMRANVYLTVNPDTKSVDISRDCISWSQWRPIPTEFLSTDYLHALSTRGLFSLHKPSGKLLIHEVPGLISQRKLHLPPGDVLGIQLLDYDQAVLYRETLTPTMYVDTSVYEYAFPATRNWLPSVESSLELPEEGAAAGDIRLVVNEDQYYIRTDKIKGWYARWWARDSKNIKTIPTLLRPLLTQIVRTIDYNDFSIDGETYFNGRIRGKVRPLYNESYTFYVSTNNDVGVGFNGTIVLPPGTIVPIETGLIDPAKEDTTLHYSFTTTPLNPSLAYPFVIDHYQAGGDQKLQLEWESASQSREVVPFSAVENDINISWVPLNFAYLSKLDQADARFIRPEQRLDLAVFYEDKTILIHLLDRITVEVFPRLRYFDYLFPEPFGARMIRRDQVYYAQEDGSPLVVPPDQIATSTEFRTQLSGLTNLDAGFGPELLYYRDSTIYNKPLLMGFWSVGIKALVPVDFTTRKSVLFSSMHAYDYLILQELKHLEVINQNGVRLPHLFDNHTHVVDQIWREAVPNAFYDVKEPNYTDEMFPHLGEYKQVKDVP